VDTIGAGDAFAGGYLAQLAKGQTVIQSVRCGLWAAAQTIQQPGFALPKTKYTERTS